jgi:hypothetical protein
MDIEEILKNANPGQFSEFDVKAILPYLKELKDKDIYLEVGVDRGRSLYVARKVTKEGVKVYGVDISDALIDQPGETTFIKNDSIEAAKNWESKISLLFIDGNHTYEGVKADIYAWLPHMKDDGIIFFHDYDITSPGVIKAVDEFVASYPVKEFKYFGNEVDRTSMAMIKL